MIDLTLNDNPCPACEELLAIKNCIKEFEIIDGESVYDTLDTIVKELKMWRAMDAYQSKKNFALKKSLIKQLETHGFEVEHN